MLRFLARGETLFEAEVWAHLCLLRSQMRRFVHGMMFTQYNQHDGLLSVHNINTD